MTVRQMAAAIVKREGGFVNDPKDAGGPTNHGVSLYKYAKGKPELDLDGDGDIDIDDIKLVTPEIAIDLYVKDFYVAPNFSKLPQPLDAQAFDLAVNAGAKRSGIVFQRALNALGANLRSIDGVLGRMTLEAVPKILNAKGMKALNNQFVAERIRFYEGLVATKPSNAKFLKGWKNRANEFRL